MTASSAASLIFHLCVCASLCCLLQLLPLPLLARAQEDPKQVHLWWEHEQFGHRDLIDRLKRYSAGLQQQQQGGEQGGKEEEGRDHDHIPLIAAFERTNTHAFVIHGPHPIRAENVRNFSRALGFT